MSNELDFNQRIINEFRANAGVVGGYFEGRTLLLLHTLGAKSQQERVNPLVYIRDNDRFVIIASKGGADTHPDWYYNLLAHPQVTLEVGTETLQMQAIVAEEPERTLLYGKMEAVSPGFAEYRLKAKRTIPVVVLVQ